MKHKGKREGENAGVFPPERKSKPERREAEGTMIRIEKRERARIMECLSWRWL